MVKLDSVTINLGFMSAKFVADELNSTFEELVGEMRAITSALNQTERDVLERLMEVQSGEVRVGELFEDFQRETEAHNALRKLRDAQFVKPAEGGRWKADKHILLKPFGVLMWRKIGPSKLFDT